MEFLKEFYLNDPLMFMTWILVVLVSLLTAFIVVSLVTSGTIVQLTRPHWNKNFYKLCKYCKRVYLRKDAYLINCPACNGDLSANLLPFPTNIQRVRVALWQLGMKSLAACLCFVLVVDIVLRANKENANLHIVILSFLLVLLIYNTYKLAKSGVIEVDGNRVIVRHGIGDRVLELSQTWISMSADGKDLTISGVSKMNRPTIKTLPCSAMNSSDIESLFKR